jgi:hypothetical protein
MKTEAQKRQFRTAINMLEPVKDGRRNRILAILEHRVSWNTFHHWLAGRWGPPDWAWDLVNEELRRRAYGLLEATKEKGQK